MRRTAAAVALALVACKSTPSLESDAPDDLTFLVVVELDDAGRPRAAGPLAPWARGEPIPVVARRPALLVGYDDAALEAAGLLDGARAVGTAPMELGSGCASRLPAATWLGSWDDGVTSIDTSQTPHLTALWIRETCPPFSPDIGFDDDCREVRCEPTVTKMETCTLQIDVKGCGLGAAEVAVGPLGQVCATFESFSKCETTVGRALGTVSCLDPRCTIDVHAKLDDRDLPMDVEIVPLIDVELLQPRTIRGAERQPWRYQLYEGYVQDFVVLDDRVVVVGPAGEATEERCTSGGEPERDLMFLDPTTLEVTGQRPTDDCMIAPIPDPVGDGFLATFRAERTGLGRYARDGVRTASVSFADGEIPGIFDSGVHSMHVAGDTIVVLTNGAGMGKKWSGLRLFDLSTLAPTAAYFLPERADEHGFVVDDDHMLLFDPGLREWTRIRLSDGDRTPIAMIPYDAMRLASLFTVHGQGGFAIAGGRGNKALTGIDENGGALWQASTYEEELHVFTMVAWPADSRFVLTGGGIYEDYRGAAALFDLETKKFVPGKVMLGESATTVMRPDGNGGVLALLPWKGQIARITPRDP